MIDLVFWSFVVALVPIALSVGSWAIAVVAGPLGPPDGRPSVLRQEFRPLPHAVTRRISRTGGFGHGH